MIKRSDSLLTPVNCKAIDAMLHALSTNAYSPVQLSCIISLIPCKENLGFIPIKPLHSDNPLDSSCFRFGQGRYGWYFFYGYLQDLAFTFIISRVEVAPPCIIRKLGITPADGCLYGVSCGYGRRGGPWNTLPATVFQGRYSCNGQDFTLDYIPDSSIPWINACSCTFKSGVFSIDIKWTTPEAKMLGFTASLSSKVGPVLNGKKGCVPCIAGIGSLYWSYTNMQVSASFVGEPMPYLGVGWMDNQWLSQGEFDSPLLTLLTNVVGMVVPPQLIRWTWMTIQIPGEDLQYNIVNMLGNDLPSTGKTYDLIAIKISKNVPTYGVKGTATIGSLDIVTQTDNGLVQQFPTQFTVKLEGRTFILKAVFGQTLVYTTKAMINWEGPGDLLDEQGKLIGNCFLEGNNLATQEQLISVPGRIAKIDPAKFHLFLARKTPLCTGIVSLIILLIVLGVIIFVICSFFRALWRALHGR